MTWLFWQYFDQMDVIQDPGDNIPYHSETFKTNFLLPSFSYYFLGNVHLKAKRNTYLLIAIMCTEKETCHYTPKGEIIVWH
jgi:hypothetical protein